jgi:hypothetical protein
MTPGGRRATARHPLARREPTMHSTDHHPREYPPVQTRRDGAGAWSTALPLLLVGLLALLLLRSCIA